MKTAILVFIDGTTCDMRHRIPLMGTPQFFSDENILADIPTPGSVACMQQLAKHHTLVYIGARPAEYNAITKRWYAENGFPDGEVRCGANQQERMSIVMELKERYEFVAGIGDRWDDNELHLALGAQSFILKEWEPNWSTVTTYLRAAL